MHELARQVPVISFRTEGDPPEIYHLMLNVVGLAHDGERRVIARRIHRCTVYLHAEYPRRPPVVTWLTPIFHPNILPPERNGGVCLGSWSASESLDDVVRRVLDMVSYKSFNTADALDQTAAAWVAEVGIAPGVDLSGVLRRTATDANALPSEEVSVVLGRRNGP